MRAYFRAHRLYAEAGALGDLGNVLNRIANTYGSLGQYDEALKFHARALDIQQQRGDQEQVGRVLHNIGVIYRQAGDPARALDTHLRALEIREQVGIRRSIARTLENIGQDYYGLGDLERAMTYYQRSLPIWEELGNKRGLANTLISIGKLHRQRGRYAAAHEALERALALATEASVKLSRSDALQELVETHRAQGRYREALEALQEYQGILVENFNEENSRTIAEMQTRFDADQKEREIELLRHQQALQAVELERQRGTRRALVGGFGLVLLILFLVFNRFRLKAREALMVETVKQERETSDRLREIDQLKDEFLANTSHELRTPLYGIIGLAESLIDGATGGLPEATKKNLSMIVQSGRRLSHLVGDILDFSKLRHQSLELDPRPVDLRPLVDVVLTLSRPLVGWKALKLSNQVSAELPPADADENRLQQVLHNLVGNAVKFTESGSIEVSAAIEDERIVVRVTDTGIGIPEAQQERIFDAFEQAEASVEREVGGTGLGLAVTRQLVELHGGEIHVESTPGEGSAFFFTLPIAKGLPDGSPVRRQQPAAPVSRLAEVGSAAVEISAGPAVEARDTPEGSARILVVDDEPVNRQVLVNQLAAQGYDVTQAASGAEALAAIDQRAADLVLLDVMMPRMSGYEVCRALRERFPLDELPVIFLTAKGQVSDLVVGLAAGANDYLPKPISRSELLARVRTHLALLHVHRQLSSLVAERTAQVTERQRLLEERERLIGKLEQRNAEMVRFNYTISHDLRNPLVTITNFLGLLRRDAVAGRPESLERDLEHLEAAADQMRQLLEDLFEFSRASVRVHPAEAVPFGELVDEVLEELSGPIAERGVVVEVEDLPIVHGDRAQLRKLVRHLLDNAVRYLGDQPAPRVEVGLERDGQDHVFYVRDNGQGIDPQYHDKIFGLFERLDTRSEGTGVGLALAKRVVEIHSGRIWVESEGREQGSTFRFTLPSPGMESFLKSDVSQVK